MLSETAFSDARRETAEVLWRLSDEAHKEATRLRDRAGTLDQESERLYKIAAAVADGRSVEEALDA